MNFDTHASTEDKNDYIKNLGSFLVDEVEANGFIDLVLKQVYENKVSVFINNKEFKANGATATCGAATLIKLLGQWFYSNSMDIDLDLLNIEKIEKDDIIIRFKPEKGVSH
jgi:hypothetical protein